MAAGLPYECWELIFGFMEHRHQLSSPSLVCKTFLSITNDLARTLLVLDPTARSLPGLLRRFTRLRAVDLSRFRGEVDGLLSLIANSESVIESLNVSNRRILPIRGLTALASKAKSLKALNCSRINVLGNEGLIFIALQFPCLEELDISFPEQFSHSLRDSPRPITDAGVRSSSKKLGSLRKINLSGNPLITDRSLKFLSMSCPLLSDIALIRCEFLTQNGIDSLIRRCVNLTSLRSSRIDCVNVHETLGDSLLRLKALRVVDFRDSGISNEWLYCIAKASLPLTKIGLANCRGFSFHGISALLSKNPSVQHLDLQGVDFLRDAMMHKFSRFLGSLTYINLSFCTTLTESTFFSLTRNCRLLREIEMGGSDIGGKDSVFGDDIVANSIQLKRLKLDGCSSLSNTCLEKITSRCPNLQSLDVSSCLNITEKGVLEALKACRGIQSLELNNCSRIKNFSLDFELSKLETLSASGSNIDDHGLKLIGSRCPRLAKLSLSRCLSITAKGVEEVVRKCRALKEIHLEHSDYVSVDVIPHLVFSRPSLREIFPPRSFVPSESQRNFYLLHGCLVHRGTSGHLLT